MELTILPAPIYFSAFLLLILRAFKEAISSELD